MSSMTRLASIAFVGLLAACGGGSHDARPTTPPPAANQATAEPPAAADSDDDASDLDRAYGDDGESVDRPASPEADRPIDAADLERRLASGEGNVPAPCLAYLQTLMKYLDCSKVPADVRASTLRGIDGAMDGWAMLNDPAVPPEARQAALDGCTQGEDALRQGAAALGCPIL